VCTLTVAAWDTLVLSPRTWRLFKTTGWPALKVAFHFLRFWMPVEFIIVAVAFFDTQWTQSQCQRFYLFEPICTAILLVVCSLVHVIRVHAIFDNNRGILALLGSLFAAQVVVTGVACAFYRSVPLLVGQGCIAGPKANWVGIYWVAPTALYTASFVLAVARSLQSLQVKKLSLWKLMLRDGLNLFGAIWIVNMVNMLFWFIVKPTGIDDTIKTTVTSMAAVLTTTMTLRIVLSVRGSLDRGGAFNGSSSAGAHGSSSGGAAPPSRGTTHVLSRSAAGGPGVLSITSPGSNRVQYIDQAKVNGQDWDKAESIHEGDNKGPVVYPIENQEQQNVGGVTITIDREVDYGKRQ